MILNRIIRSIQSRLKSQRIRRAMALEHQALKSKQSSAIVPAMIDSIGWLIFGGEASANRQSDRDYCCRVFAGVIYPHCFV